MIDLSRAHRLVSQRTSPFLRNSLDTVLWVTWLWSKHPDVILPVHLYRCFLVTHKRREARGVGLNGTRGFSMTLSNIMTGDIMYVSHASNFSIIYCNKSWPFYTVVNFPHRHLKQAAIDPWLIQMVDSTG